MANSTDRDQQSKNLGYLQDAVRNATTNIQGCLRHIEEQIRFITEATNTYKRGLDED